MPTTQPLTPRPCADRPALRWLTPGLAVGSGLALGVASWVGGHPLLGAFLALWMLLVSAAAMLAARYSETVRGLLDRRDERISGIDLQATAFAGVTMIVAVLIAVGVELARGRDGTPYLWIASLGGISYLAAVIALRVRR